MASPAGGSAAGSGGEPKPHRCSPNGTPIARIRSGSAPSPRRHHVVDPRARLTAEVREDVAHVDVEVDDGRVLTRESAIAAARLVVRNVLPLPPLEEKTEMMWPRSWCVLVRGAATHRTQVGRPTRSRARRRRGAPPSPGSCPRRRGCRPASPRAASRSTCGRGPGRSRSPATGAPDELGETQRVGLLDLRREHQHVDRRERR